MLNIGPAELLVIGLVVLIAVGPEQLPSVIRRVGNTVGQFRNMTDGLRSEFMAGLDELERTADPRRWAEDDPAHQGQSTTNGSGMAVTDGPVDDDKATGEDKATAEDEADGEADEAGGNANAAADGVTPIPHPAPFAASGPSQDDDTTPPRRGPFEGPGTHTAAASAAGDDAVETPTDTGAAASGTQVDLEAAAAAEAAEAAEAAAAADAEPAGRAPAAAGGAAEQTSGEAPTDPTEGREPELAEGSE